MTYVFYARGVAINVMYGIDDPKQRAVGFSSRKAWMSELARQFKLAA